MKTDSKKKIKIKWNEKWKTKRSKENWKSDHQQFFANDIRTEIVRFSEHWPVPFSEGYTETKNVLELAWNFYNKITDFEQNDKFSMTLTVICNAQLINMQEVRKVSKNKDLSFRTFYSCTLKILPA